MIIGERRITVLFNNIGHDPRLDTAHGLSCLIEGDHEPILFDSGGDGILLLKNMRKLGKDPRAIRTVVVSHMHWDHSGGLFVFLHSNPRVEIFMPASVSKNFRRHVEWLGAKVKIVKDHIEIAKGLYSTGTMGSLQSPREKKEQSLLFEAPEGLVVLTACAHPGILEIVEKAVKVKDLPVFAVLGGFHLINSSRLQIEKIIRGFRELGIRKLGASHCSGAAAIAKFEAIWEKSFVRFGCGETFRIRSVRSRNIG